MTRCIAFKVVPNSPPGTVGRDDDMNRIGANIQRMQPPSPMENDLFNRTMDDRSLYRAKMDGRVFESLKLATLALLIGF